jgi:hypothetical protein
MNIHDVIAAIKAGPNDITPYPGATQELIDEFEKQAGFKLPADLRTFYQSCNGFESAEDLFRIIPLDEALETRARDMLEYRLRPNQFYIAEYLIYCDMWTIEIELDQPNIYRITHDPAPNAITHSFSEFLLRFLKGGVFEEGGLYKWDEEPGR